MLITEFHITLPLTLEEFQIGNLYSVTKASKQETGGNEGFEWITNEPFTGTDKFKYSIPGVDIPNEGQYTRKKCHLVWKLPTVIRRLSPKDSLVFVEESWNSFPYCHTDITNEFTLRETFCLTIDTIASEKENKSENIFGLSEQELSLRTIKHIDIARDPVSPTEYKPEEDPTKFESKKTRRGSLLPNWKQVTKHKVFVYKLVKSEFNWSGINSKVSIGKMIHNAMQRYFTVYHRQVFCWVDEWHGLTLENIREIEDKTKQELDEMRPNGTTCGMLMS